ncbi:hypothetical protein [Nostoc sp. PCC 7107]|uniref:hypothetical protein n=1 Tax=Nostoc sp. PCC 7107 TaxID=317936 RepID=UPI00029EEA8F|nr:hypothetical protein [Nostoc sp. PCC 7107]AFY43670.1 hypothetical protein Nos7107_3079 [Nostoc sp. PCC 7107]
MFSSLKDSVDVILSVTALIGIIFHIAKIKADIEKAIDDVKDELRTELMSLNTDVKVSRAQQEGKKEMVEYFINDLYYQIHHKFYRVWNEVKDLQSFLQKDGYVARVRHEEPPAPKKIKIDEI